MEEPDSAPTDSEFEMAEESNSGEANHASDDVGDLYIPEFLGEAKYGEWGLTIRMAQVIQAEKQQQKKCFICQSPDHFARNCPQAKNVRRPLQLRGLPKQHWLRQPRPRYRLQPLCPLGWYRLRPWRRSKGAQTGALS